MFGVKAVIYNLNVSWNIGIICILILLPIPINSHNVKHPLLSLVEQNIPEGARVENRLLGECSKLLSLPNGRVNMTDGEGGRRTLHFSCYTGYRLLGPPKLLCPPEEWQQTTPFCERTGCLKLPMIMNGGERITGVSSSDGEEELYPEGVVIEYQCESGFRLMPITSQHRVCREGKWTGSEVSCVFEGCPRIDHPNNGYIEELDRSVTQGDYGHVRPGVRVFFKCNEGFTLVGPTQATCQSTGRWQPHTQPVCQPDYRQTSGKCLSLPPSPLVQIFSDQPADKSTATEEGAVLQVGCAPGYRDKSHGCKTRLIRCVKGEWIGHMPVCIRTDDCIFPPKIPHGQIEQLDGGVGGGRVGIGGQVTYSCLDGYQLSGESTLTCVVGGCWQPSTLPYCEPEFYFATSWPEYFNPNTSLLFSIVTALSILFVLLSVCIAVVCRHRTENHRHHHHSPAVQGAPTLLPPPPDPDRVALIAFADGIQSGLPSYEEAVRNSNRGGLLPYRLHHPPWSSVVRRGGQLLSTLGDGMGSTDTMTVSDTSTTVTLDTVSCNTCSSTGTSQTASCRAICGSLASFDTSSVVNTEGVPLLEENELEESGVAMLSGIEGSTPPACDNTSFKLQSDIDSIHS